jgi:FkbM family methyltransferase
MRFLFGWLNPERNRLKGDKKGKRNAPPVPDWLKNLKAGDVALDCGANVGKITVPMAKTGATVYAFEPNPHAFARLKAAVAAYPNVTCFQQAVGVESGLVRLYMHEQADEDPVHWSTGSSLLEFKGNVNPERYFEVECIDLAAFIRSLGRRVAVLKMDVEGVECPILKTLIESGLIHEIDQLLCEMHDKKVAELREPSDEIRRLVKERNLTHVDLNWI